MKITVGSYVSYVRVPKTYYEQLHITKKYAKVLGISGTAAMIVDLTSGEDVYIVLSALRRLKPEEEMLARFMDGTNIQ